MEIRIAEYNDYERIASLHAQSWQTFYQGILGDEYLRNEVVDDRLLIWQTRLINPPYNQHVLVAENNGELCGFICAFGNHDFEKGTMIDALHVDARYRSKGVGRALVAETAKWIEQHFSDGGVYLEVLKGNQQGIDFYQNLGGTNSLERIWNSPCGNSLTELVYTWNSPAELLNSASTRQLAY